MIRTPIAQIDFLVRNIPITTNHILPTVRAHLFKLWHEFIKKAELSLLAFVGARSRWQIDRDHCQAPKTYLHPSTFRIEFHAGHTHLHSTHRVATINRDPAIAFFFCVMKMAVITRRGKHFGAQISRLRLEFLHADQVGFLLRKPVPYAFG